jgi:hypothetical protein
MSVMVLIWHKEGYLHSKQHGNFNLGLIVPNTIYFIESSNLKLFSQAQFIVQKSGTCHNMEAHMSLVA